MAAEDLAFHYLLVGLGLAFFSYFVYGYIQNGKETFGILKSLVLRVAPTFAYPPAYLRITLIVPLYTTLTMRVVKRFWINHGFKLVFMVAFGCYFWNVWSESLADDPFTIVGVSPSADAKAVRKACRQGSLKLHPDKHPGQEEEIRPLFEKHTRACKVLNDPKLREKYMKWGTLPKNDKETGGEMGPAIGGGPSMLSVGGGSYLFTFCFFFLLFLGVPSLAAYYLLDMLYDEEGLLQKVASESKALSNDMCALYTGYEHYNDLVIDVAELYLETAQAEIIEMKNSVTAINPRGAKSLDSVINMHAKRIAHWKEGNNVNKEKQNEYKADGAKLDAQLKVAMEAIDNVAKKSKGSSKKHA